MPSFTPRRPYWHFNIGEFQITAALVCHPGPTVGYRIADRATVMTYIPDHEPALGARSFPQEPEWTSGFDLATDADLLIHDAQYSANEYPGCVGWGHSAIPHAIAFAIATKVKQLVAFHHDPSHSDAVLDRLFVEARSPSSLPCELIPGREGMHFQLGRHS